MQRKQWLFAVIAAAAMAAVATWQIRGRRGDEKRPEAAAKATEGGHAFSHRHGKDDRRETPVDEPELRNGPSRVIFAEDPRGQAKLSGRVVDGAGAPVAGATISVTSRPPRQATSGADGAFSFDGLLPLPYLVTAYAPSGVAGPVEVKASDTDGGAPLQLAMRAGQSVELEAVDGEGKPVDGATVELRGALEIRVAKAAQGRAVIGPVASGSYHVAVWAEGYAPSFQPLVVSGDATFARVELAKGSPVHGHVVDDAGKPVAGARVRFEAATDAIAGTDLVRDSTLTDQDGKFGFPAMALGSYRFVATHATLGTQASSVMRVEGRELSDVSIAMPAGAAVSGRVVDGSGAPAAFARVRLGITIPGSRLVVPPRELTTNEKGEFALSGLARRQLTAVAVHERGSSPAVIVDAREGDVANVLLTLEAREALSGSVVDGAGKPVAGARVSVWPAVLERASGDGHGHGAGADAAAGSDSAAAAAASGTGNLSLRKWQLVGFPSALTDERGAFRVTGLAPGGYRLRASRPDALSDERGLPGDFVDAKAGDSAVRVALPAEGAVRGRVAFADGATPERGTVAVGFAQRSFRGGALAIDALPPQTYQLVVRGPTFEPKVLEVKVEAGKVIDLGTVVVKPLP